MIERAEPFRFGDGASIGVGSLPHRDADAAAAFAIGEFDISTIPSLPQLSSSEGMVEQATEPLNGPGFTGLRTFVDLNPEFETAIERLASFLARDDEDDPDD